MIRMVGSFQLIQLRHFIGLDEWKWRIGTTAIAMMNQLESKSVDGVAVIFRVSLFCWLFARNVRSGEEKMNR